jgi:hypothetical protein
MIVLGWFAFAIATVGLAIIVRGWVLTVLWSWFVVPTFSLPELSIPVALGFTLIVGMFTHHLAQKTANDTTRSTATKVGEVIGAAIVNPLIVLLFGWIIQSFM